MAHDQALLLCERRAIWCGYRGVGYTGELGESNFRVGGKAIQWPPLEVVVVGMAVVVAAVPIDTASVRRGYAGHHEKA